MGKRKTTEQFKKEVFDLVKDEYTVLGEYTRVSEKIKMRHNECGYEYEVAPYHFLRGNRCPKCRCRRISKALRKTTESFEEEIFNMYKGEYTLVGEYIKDGIDVRVKHNKCGTVYNVSPQYFLKGRGKCPKCRKEEEFYKNVDKLKEIVGDLYTVVSIFKEDCDTIVVRHRECGNEFKTTFKKFFKGHRCHKCKDAIDSKYSYHHKGEEWFRERMELLYGEQYTLLSTYANTDSVVILKHNRCGHEYSVRAGDFLRGSKCPKCYGTPKRTTEQFKKDVYNLVGDEYTVLGEYKSNQTKILMKHNKCGYEYEAMPSNFLRQGISRCPVCSKGSNLTTDILRRKINNMYGDEYILLGEYINSNTKVSLRHNDCGYEWDILPGNILSGQKCPKCSTGMKSHQQFAEEFRFKFGDEYTLLSEYNGSTAPIKVRHDVCGTEWETAPYTLMKSTGCPKLNINHKKDTEEFVGLVSDLVGDEYTVLGEYVNNQTKILMRHEKCGNEYEVTPGHFFQGQRCPYCNTSKGEDIISKYLDEFGLEFEIQKSFPDMKHIRNLRFDFYLPNFRTAIEYDGRQHFEPVNFGGISDAEALENLKLTQERDKAKDEYCKNSGIKLVRIPYWDYKNIKRIIKNWLNVKAAALSGLH